MGVINATDDSFYAGSRVASAEKAAERAAEMVAEGADIIDIGAYSTRPGGAVISPEAERAVLTETVRAVRSALPKTVISADTFRADVAEAAVNAGADMVNDVGGGSFDPRMIETVAACGVPYVLMHNRGTPTTMHKNPAYRDVVNEVVYELSVKLDALYAAGVADVIVDPGFGFAKTPEHNFELLMRLEELSVLDTPVLAGLSRKSMIWRTLGITAADALNGTTALNMLALERGADILRVHDVRAAAEAAALWEVCRLHTYGARGVRSTFTTAKGKEH